MGMQHSFSQKDNSGSGCCAKDFMLMSRFSTAIHSGGDFRLINVAEESAAGIGVIIIGSTDMETDVYLRNVSGDDDVPTRP